MLPFAPFFCLVLGLACLNGCAATLPGAGIPYPPADSGVAENSYSAPIPTPAPSSTAQVDPRAEERSYSALPSNDGTAESATSQPSQEAAYSDVPALPPSNSAAVFPP